MRRHSGFTLAELLVVLAVAGVSLALGVPAMGATISRIRTDTTFNSATTAFAYARLSAITRRTAMVACPSSDGVECRADGDWSTGWIVRIDPRDAHRGDPVLRRFDAPGRDVRMYSSKGRPFARFLANGSSHGSNLTLTVCDASTRERLGAVVLNNSGRARSERERRHAPCPAR